MMWLNVISGRFPESFAHSICGLSWQKVIKRMLIFQIILKLLDKNFLYILLKTQSVAYLHIGLSKWHETQVTTSPWATKAHCSNMQRVLPWIHLRGTPQQQHAPTCMHCEGPFIAACSFRFYIVLRVKRGHRYCHPWILYVCRLNVFYNISKVVPQFRAITFQKLYPLMYLNTFLVLIIWSQLCLPIYSILSVWWM